MKINKQDEYGLRIILRIAKERGETGLSIPQLSELEGISQPYVGKLTRALRMSGLIESNRGQKGGYVLARPASDIMVKEVVDSMGGQLFSQGFCGDHSGQMMLCTNSVDCSVRSLWRVLQYTVDKVLNSISLLDLLVNEKKSVNKLEDIVSDLFADEMIPV